MAHHMPRDSNLNFTFLRMDFLVRRISLQLRQCWFTLKLRGCGGLLQSASKLASLRTVTILLLLVSSYSHLEAGLSVGPTSTFYFAFCVFLCHSASSKYHHSFSLFISSYPFYPFVLHVLLLCILRLFVLWFVKYMGEAVPYLKVLPQDLFGCEVKVLSTD